MYKIDDFDQPFLPTPTSRLLKVNLVFLKNTCILLVLNHGKGAKMSANQCVQGVKGDHLKTMENRHKSMGSSSLPYQTICILKLILKYLKCIFSI